MDLVADTTPPSVGVQPVRVAEIHDIAEGVRELVLRSADDTALAPWTAGAHIDLVLRDGLVRPYSLCSDPAKPDSWTVAVLRENESRGASEFIHSGLREGDVIAVRPPRNGFPLIDASEYALIAGGIGITPLLPMIAELERRGASWRLLYGGRTRASMAYLAELERFGPRVTVAPEDETGLLDLAGWLGEHPGDMAVYCCGPEGLLGAVERAKETWPATTSLSLERFRADPAVLHGQGEDHEFEVVAAQSGVRTTVQQGTSIIEALEDVGVYIPTSCGEGTCETCICQVIEGSADHRDSLLTDDQRQSGQILPCCSRSASAVLVLDI